MLIFHHFCLCLWTVNNHTIFYYIYQYTCIPAVVFSQGARQHLLWAPPRQPARWAPSAFHQHPGEPPQRCRGLHGCLPAEGHERQCDGRNMGWLRFCGQAVFLLPGGFRCVREHRHIDLSHFWWLSVDLHSLSGDPNNPNPHHELTNPYLALTQSWTIYTHIYHRPKESAFCRLGNHFFQLLSPVNWFLI